VLNAKVAVALFAAVAALLAWRLVVERRQPPPPPPAAIQLKIPPPEGAVFGAALEPVDAALSTVGEELVFVATSNGISQLWRRALGSDHAEPVAGTEGARQPAWSPGRREASFFAGDMLKRTDFEGGISDVATLPDAAGVAWEEDGSVLVGRNRGAVDRWRAGQVSPATRLKDGDVAHKFPWRIDAISWLYLAERADGRRVVRIVGEGGEHDLTNADGHAMAVAGWLLYPRGGALLAQRLRSDGAVEGRGHPLALGLGVSASGRTFAAVSPRMVVFAAAPAQQHRLQWFDGAGAPQAIASEPGDYWQVRLSPDGRQAAVTMLEPLLRTLDVYVFRGGSGAPVPVTLGLAADTDPVWSPDGRRLLFRSVRNGQARLFTREVGTTGATEDPLLAPPSESAFANVLPSDWPRSGEILFSANSQSRPNTDVLRAPGGSTQPVPMPVLATGFNESDARLSPDGRWVAYVSDESGQRDVYVSGWPQGPRVRVSQAGGSHPRWTRTSLYFLRGDEVLRAGPTPGAAPSFDVPARVLALPGIRDFDVSQAGDRLLAIVPAAATRPPDVGAIVDWPSALAVFAKSE
jgi:dipeptidyl aminopeptidase/acylaminoacyl peptidase